jgi:LemA protein
MSKSIGCGILLVLVLIVLAVGGMLWTSYNRLVTIDQRVNTAWANVQTQYQRRYDLIPNLVNTVAGAANFEKSTLTEVTNARASVGSVKLDPSKAPTDPAQMAQFEAAQGQLGNALSRLLVVAENYPQLHATENFQSLQAQIEGTENRINASRQDYNEVVQTYNTMVKRFPTVLIAGMLGFQPRPPFTSQPGAEKAPTVNFNFGNATATPAPAGTP